MAENEMLELAEKFRPYRYVWLLENMIFFGENMLMPNPF
jgi:hypothetical protein